MGEGRLLQLRFVDPLAVSVYPLASSGAEDRQRALEALSEIFEPIPQYDLVVMADMATETEQLAMIGLVYDDVADAELALSVLRRRIATHVSSFLRQSLVEGLYNRGADRFKPTIFSDGHTTVLLMTISAPLASNLPPEDPLMPPGYFERSSRLYWLFSTMVDHRDTGWLATELPPA